MHFSSKASGNGSEEDAATLEARPIYYEKLPKYTHDFFVGLTESTQ